MKAGLRCSGQPRALCPDGGGGGGLRDWEARAGYGLWDRALLCDSTVKYLIDLTKECQVCMDFF